ncbi:MAG: hypothetical protein JETCAE01_26840 [Anaerolineaceae bacterium]|nr:MAG: hypothetical protein JETCAE01_26840 [Anaerolineaceae bacterium]
MRLVPEPLDRLDNHAGMDSAWEQDAKRARSQPVLVLSQGKMHDCEASRPKDDGEALLAGS